MGKFSLASRVPADYAGAESDGPGCESDPHAPKREPAVGNLGKIVSAVMQWLQGGLAGPLLALHMQQDYLTAIQAQRLLIEQN